MELGRPRRQDGERVRKLRDPRGDQSEVRKLIEEERSPGWMVEMSDKEEQEACGEKLYIASMAVVTEKDKIRLVHNATNKVQVNNRTRVRVRDQAKMFAVNGDAKKRTGGSR